MAKYAPLCDAFITEIKYSIVKETLLKLTQTNDKAMPQC